MLNWIKISDPKKKTAAPIWSRCWCGCCRSRSTRCTSPGPTTSSAASRRRSAASPRGTVPSDCRDHNLFLLPCEINRGSEFWWGWISRVCSVTSCAEIMEKHLEQSVLSKLPYGYDSVTRQSLSSTEDDMGICPSLHLPNYRVPCFVATVTAILFLLSAASVMSKPVWLVETFVCPFISSGQPVCILGDYGRLLCSKVGFLHNKKFSCQINRSSSTRMSPLAVLMWWVLVTYRVLDFCPQIMNMLPRPH